MESGVSFDTVRARGLVLALSVLSLLSALGALGGCAALAGLNQFVKDDCDGSCDGGTDGTTMVDGTNAPDTSENASDSTAPDGSQRGSRDSDNADSSVTMEDVAQPDGAVTETGAEGGQDVAIDTGCGPTDTAENCGACGVACDTTHSLGASCNQGT